jgi:hypothetical protein
VSAGDLDGRDAEAISCDPAQELRRNQAIVPARQDPCRHIWPCLEWMNRPAVIFPMVSPLRTGRCLRHPIRRCSPAEVHRRSPKDILESARIDGASEFQIFVRLILPLGLPAIASVATFRFLWTWNDLIVALTFGQHVEPIRVAIFSNLRQFGANIALIAPASFISLIVPLAVFFAFQRYFVQGLLAGSVT